MFWSNRDIQWGTDRGKLIVHPRPEVLNAGYDATSIDLHLDNVKQALIWDAEQLQQDQRALGVAAPEVPLGSFDYGAFARKYLVAVPKESGNTQDRQRQLVCRRGDLVIVKPGGFLLWTTKEVVGTPQKDPELICFVEGKSTRARTGLLVHLTAPTIHAGWSGNITLEIANLGPFHFVLKEKDVIAQLTVATISSAPNPGLKKSLSATQGQTTPRGAPSEKPTRKGGKRK